jgi:hypothetical protein
VGRFCADCGSVVSRRAFPLSWVTSVGSQVTYNVGHFRSLIAFGIYIYAYFHIYIYMCIYIYRHIHIYIYIYEYIIVEDGFFFCGIIRMCSYECNVLKSDQIQSNLVKSDQI